MLLVSGIFLVMGPNKLVPQRKFGFSNKYQGVKVSKENSLGSRKSKLLLLLNEYIHSSTYHRSYLTIILYLSFTESVRVRERVIGYA